MQDKVLGQTKDMVLFANTTLQNYAQQKIPDRALNANFMSLVTSWVIPKLLSKKSSMEGDAREGFEYLQCTFFSNCRGNAVDQKARDYGRNSSDCQWNW